MLSAREFAEFISVSLEAGRANHQRHEVLGLKGAKRGLRFPKWQVTSNGGLLQTCHSTSIFLAAIPGRSVLIQPKFRFSEFAFRLLLYSAGFLFAALHYNLANDLLAWTPAPGTRTI